MEGFPILGKGGLDPKQQELWDKLTLGPRGFYTGGAEAERLPDLYNAWLQFPELGQIMLRLGDDVRAASNFPGNLRELIVLTTSAQLGARVEFDFHVPFALNEGLKQEQIDAIAQGREPDLTDEVEKATYDANLQLLRTATLEPETRDNLVRCIGYPGLVQLLATVMLYVITAWTTNIARVKLADDFSADPSKLADFFAGNTADQASDPAK